MIYSYVHDVQAVQAILGFCWQKKNFKKKPGIPGIIIVAC